MPIRVSAKAIIIQNSALLVIRKRDRDGIYYILPGGGQNHGEALSDAVKRECLEEVNLDVHVGSVLFIRDYIGKNHEHAEFDGDTHQVEIMFACTPLKTDHSVGNGSEPDDGQEGVEWLPLDAVETVRIYPKTLSAHLHNLSAKPAATAIYLGDVN